MSALYDLFENPPSPDGEKQPLHARIVSKGTVDKEQSVTSWRSSLRQEEPNGSLLPM